MIDVNGKIKYSEIYLGGRNISKMYYGEHLVWPDEITPQSGNYRYFYTTFDGTSGMSECNVSASSILFRNAEPVNSPETFPPTINAFYIGECIDGLQYNTNSFNSFRNFSYCELVDMSKSKITAIPDRMFSYIMSPKRLKTVKFNNTLTSIGNYSFSACTYLESPVFPESLTSIGQYAFDSCSSIEEITFPKNLTDLGHTSFKGCTNLKRVNGLEDLKFTSLNGGEFSNCTSLPEITLPKTLNRIGSNTLNGCTNLKTVKNLDDVREIEQYAFNECTNLTDFVISPNIRTIGSHSFYHCTSIDKQIVLGQFISLIDTQAFRGCTSIPSFKILATIPPQLGTYAFNDTNDCPIYVPCEALSAYLSATNWKDYASRIRPIEGECDNYRLKRVARDGSVYYLECNPDGYSNSITQDNARRGLKSSASLSSATSGETPVEVYIGGCCDGISVQAFNDFRYLTKVYINGNTDIGNQAFQDCYRLEYIEINGITNSISNLHLNTNVTSCKIVVNGQINTIYSTLVDSNSKIEAIYFHQLTPPRVDNYTFDKIGNIYVPCEAVDIYKEKLPKWADIIIAWDYAKNTYCPIYRWDVDGDRCVDGDLYENLVQKVSYDNGKTWSVVTPLQEKQGELLQEGGCPTVDSGKYEYTTSDGQKTVKEGKMASSQKGIEMMIEDLPEDITSLGVGCGADVVLIIGDEPRTELTRSQLKSIYVCDDIKELHCEFSDCTALTDVRLSNNQIDSCAFTNCTSLEKISIPNSAVDIPHFSGCTSLKDVKLSYNTPELNIYSFNNCTSLEEIYLPPLIKKIGGSAFAHCEKLKEIVIPDSVTEIGDRAFIYCSSLSSITLSENITRLNDYTFEGCAISSITIPSKVSRIGGYPFDGCYNLREITILATTPPNLSSPQEFRNTDLTVIYVPSESLTRYKNATNWKNYASIIQPLT